MLATVHARNSPGASAAMAGVRIARCRVLAGWVGRVVGRVGPRQKICTLVRMRWRTSARASSSACSISSYVPFRGAETITSQPCSVGKYSLL